MSNPHGYDAPGAGLWAQYADAYVLEASDETLRHSACACADLVAQLDAITREKGPLGDDGKTASWVTEARFQKGILLKLTAQLARLAQSENGEGAIHKNLGGSRGSYSARSA